MTSALKTTGEMPYVSTVGNSLLGMRIPSQKIGLPSAPSERGRAGANAPGFRDILIFFSDQNFPGKQTEWCLDELNRRPLAANRVLDRCIGSAQAG